MQLANFARDVGNLSRIVTLDEINLKPKSDAKGKTTQLELTATANTYTAAAQKAEEPATETTAASE
jgi:type IV pilus assembly protein PilO